MLEDSLIHHRLHDARAFLIEEAWLLDRQDYHEWGKLWAEEGLYVVPADPDTKDFENSLNYIYDDGDMRMRRIQRLLSDTTLIMAPPPRTMRMISCVRLNGDQIADVSSVTSSLQVIASRHGQQTIFAAHVEHFIRWSNEGPKLLNKIVRLINADHPLTDFSFIL
jgi:3-phenylpropionate/cinnamic acid dioxygenase small subunit